MACVFKHLSLLNMRQGRSALEQLSRDQVIMKAELLQCAAKYNEVCISMPKMAKYKVVKQNMYVKVRQSMPMYAKVCQYTPLYARIHQSML